VRAVFAHGTKKMQAYTTVTIQSDGIRRLQMRKTLLEACTEPLKEVPGSFIEFLEAMMAEECLAVNLLVY